MGLDTSTSSIFATLSMQAILGGIFYLLFELFRKQNEIYAPKLRSKPKRCPSKPSSHFFGWIQPLLSITDEETLRLTGLDGYIFLRFLKLCAKMALGCGLFGLIFLLPIYKTAPAHQKGVVGIMLYTMANISPGGPRLWASFICAYLFTFVFLYLMYKEYEHFTEMRQQYMRDGDPDVAQQQLYSCIVENIPLELRGSNKLQQLFEQLFPGEVYCARIGMNYTPIIKAAMERKAAITALENATAAYEASDRTKPPMVKLKGGKVAMCGGTEEVEAIKFYEKEVTRLNERIIELKQQARDMENGRTPTPSVVDGETAEEEEENFTPKSLAGTGFVTFRSKRAQAAAYQLTVLHDQYPSLKAFQVQAPQNIIWDNLAVKIDQIKVVSMGTRAMYYGGLLFWAAILVVISGLAQMSNLEKYFPFLKQLDPVSYAILEGQLPVIALIVFIALLPMIFTSVSTYIERRKTKSDVQKEVFTWFFCYQLANVYLMLLAGSVLGALTSIIDNPLSIVNLLAAALPGVATFFINYLLTLLMSGVPMLLLNIGPVVIYKLYLSCFNPRKLTRRTLIEGPLANVDINYALVVPPVIYCLCISLLYMVIAPILLFIAGLLFSAWFVAWKYRLCYIIVPGVQSGGVFWYKMFNFSMTGLMFATLTMIGYMGIKQGAAQTVLLIPLPIIVNIVWSIAQDKFQQFSSDMAHHQAVLKDTKTGSGSSLDAETEFHDDFFVPPQLSGPVTACPEPYRIDNIPLVDEHGHLNPAYHTSANTTVNAVYRKKMSDYKPSNSTKSENDELKPMQVTQYQHFAYTIVNMLSFA